MFEGYETKLFDQWSQPLLVTQGGKYFSPYSAENVGKFSPYTNLRTQPANVSVSQYDRQQLTALSQDLFENMSELNAAIDLLATFVVGRGLDPVYLGVDTEWSDTASKWLMDVFYNNCSWNGFAFDWKACWKLVIKKIIIDGDILLVFSKDRNGFPKIDFIENYRIATRNGQTEIADGRYAGYAINDGVITNSAGTPIAYQIIGEKPADDYIIATPSNCLLLYSPFSFEKGRGLPALKSALKDGTILRELDDAIQQGLKAIQNVYLINQNETGRAPQGKVSNPFQQTNGSTVASPALPFGQLSYGGINYIKSADDVKTLESNRPATQLQDFLTRLEKRMLMNIPFPHQFLLTPELIGGAASRGVKEILMRSIQDKQDLIRLPALTSLRYAISTAMVNGLIPKNYKEDFTNWTFTRSAEIVLDAGYERAADIADIASGVKSIDEVVSKTGKRYKDVLKQRVKDFQLTVEALKEAEALEPEYKELAKKMIVGQDLELTVPSDPVPATK